MKLVVGLTGGIASGKSAVGEAFQQLGTPVLDADQVSRAVVLPGSTGLEKIVAHFGAQMLDEQGQLNRPHMRKTVFSDASARLELERILHPLIRQNILHWRDQCEAAYCVLMVPLLVKMGWNDLVDRLLVVDCDVEIQRKRLVQRDDIDTTLADKMIAAQDSREQRNDAADDLIFNAGSLEDLQAMTALCHQSYLDFAEGRSKSIRRLWLPTPSC